MLKLEDVHTYYGYSHILQGLSFSVPKGKCVALLGRNGAGKTTTIHSIAGLTPPRTGRISYLDKPISGLPPYKIARHGIGLVPQGRRIFPSLTIRENLIVPAKDSRQTEAGQKKWDLEAVFELFPVLKEREQNMGTQLSGGQQQMLAIGRALMTNPQCILMDEPSEGLAPVIIEQVGEIITRLKDTGLSILLVEQNFYLACGAADHVLVMSKGQIVWQGSPTELLANEEIQHQYLGV
ncbi:ABC transporter ATP-binding protein [Brevibacillus centrosporus]|uniref:ABC transporter ATP-binding protein n=1 Tax=Brevibacillus centrosporus TaxID=54910 RepID=UPI000F0A0381|nr:ABC transporter ATP-binding protein [Brevibacillus centrosporus]MEC2133184.1 ABC transporter ATP-binding protein [Brevibacillus centrosporus]RNB64928.1 ABC transporter ATP-binding protein [Brevibacillus centrosporus]GED31211.1 ABC transporter ATP-binding protein [Brevibacillus centrosporus]